LDDFNNALAQQPDDAVALSRRADVYFAINQLDKAQADLQRVVQLKPDDFSAQDRLMNVSQRLAASRAPAAAPAQAVATPPPTPTPKQPLVTRENILIACGALVVLALIAVVIARIMMQRSSSRELE
jgi:tetratricopeptide (TPR) repeat protein